jgi:hypothetical protein
MHLRKHRTTTAWCSGWPLSVIAGGEFSVGWSDYCETARKIFHGRLPVGERGHRSRCGICRGPRVWETYSSLFVTCQDS